MRIFTAFLSAKEGSIKKDLSFLSLFFGIAFFQFLGSIPLLEPDEGRYAEIPREMLERGDFLTPFLNYVKYFEKPPLHYWLNAISFSIFGENEFAARFPGALMGLLTVILTYHAGRRLFGRRAGLLAALILGTSVGFLLQARIDITDMTLTCTLSAALFFFAMAAREGESRKTLYYHGFYLCAALAVLAKGLIGLVFPCAIVTCYLAITRRWGILREMRLLTGIILFFLVAAPWFIMMSLRNPEFPRFFFIHEHFERFLSKVHGRYRPFWYFIPVLAGTMMPWSFFIPSALRGIWRERISPEGESRLYLALWAIVVFLFFSASDSKLIPYILPVLPPLALLMGSAFAHSPQHIDRVVKTEGYLVAFALTLLGAGGICYPFITDSPDLSVAAGVVLGAILLGEGIMSFISIHRKSLNGMVSGMILCSYIFGIVSPTFVLAEMAGKRSVRELANMIRVKAGKEAMVASFGLVQGLSFYARRRVVVVGPPGEAEFGSRQGDNSAWFYDISRFLHTWNSPATVYLLLTNNEYELFQAALHPAPRVIARSGNFILITNH